MTIFKTLYVPTTVLLTIHTHTF